MFPPIERACFWLASRSGYQPNPPLEGNCEAEIAVIGAGFTGLWTAFFLQQLQPGLDVAVIEQGVTGYGASGRNAGMISSCVDHSHGLAISHFGQDEAIRLAKIGFSNIDELESFAQGCDFERTGQLQVALTETQVEECRANAELCTELGFPGYKFLSAEETRCQVNSPLYLASAFSPGGGIINPIKLVDKLKNESQKNGTRYFENSKVTGIDEGTITTINGKLKAKKIILATDAYTHHLFPQLLWRYIPLYDYILVSQPLSVEQKNEIGWQNRQGVIDGRTFFNYYRLTDDNRILWGTSEAMYYPPNQVDESCDHSQHHYQTLKQSFQRHFPALADLEFPYAWGGPIASTTRLTPFFGSLQKGRILYALGYTGHGIGSTRLAGKILAHMALSRQSDLLKLSMVKNKPFPYPPEPLRSLAVKAVTGSLKAVDQGKPRSLLLQVLDLLGIGFSS